MLRWVVSGDKCFTIQYHLVVLRVVSKEDKIPTCALMHVVASVLVRYQVVYILGCI